MITRNAAQLKAYLKNAAQKLGVGTSQILQNYVMERLTARISKSRYHGNFIVKGGFLITQILGAAFRTTQDLDTTITGFSLTKEEIQSIFQEICGIDANDDFIFTLQDVVEIRKDDDYPGLRLKLQASYETVKVSLSVDPTSGDAITPKERSYKIVSLLDNTEIIRVLAYPLETLLAEKIETVLQRGTVNTRVRDFYDIYHLLKRNPRLNLLKEALINTTRHRKTSYLLTGFSDSINQLKNSRELNQHWKVYKKKYDYAASLALEDVCLVLNQVMLEMFNPS